MPMHFGPAGHEVEKGGCDACVHHAFPEPHACGGYLHAEPTEDDEGADVTGVLTLQCDKCGATGTRAMPMLSPETERALAAEQPVAKAKK